MQLRVWSFNKSIDHLMWGSWQVYFPFPSWGQSLQCNEEFGQALPGNLVECSLTAFSNYKLRLCKVIYKRVRFIFDIRNFFKRHCSTFEPSMRVQILWWLSRLWHWHTLTHTHTQESHAREAHILLTRGNLKT